MAKRQRKDGQLQKNQRRLKSPTPPLPQPSLSPTEVQPTKIIDLNDDCLIKIFNHLDLQNLFNVAVANEFLRPAAAIVYKRKFGVKMVEIYRVHGTRRITRASVRNKSPDRFAAPKEWKYSIDIRSSRLCFQYIRCFGPSIAHLTIDYNESWSKLYDHLHQYINEYCAESLIEIGFWLKPNRPIEEFVKPFVSVERVNIWYGDFGEQLPKLVEWFPHLHHLELHNAGLDRRFAAVHFQHLKHLCVDDHSHGNFASGGFAAANAVELIQSNRQLESLEIKSSPHKMPIETLLDIIKDTNRSIRKLELTYQCEVVPVDSNLVKRFANEHPEMIHLNLPYHQFRPEDVNTLMKQLSALETLHCHMQNYSDFQAMARQLNERWHANFEFNFVALKRQ